MIFDQIGRVRAECHLFLGQMSISGPTAVGVSDPLAGGRTKLQLGLQLLGLQFWLHQLGLQCVEGWGRAKGFVKRSFVLC